MDRDDRAQPGRGVVAEDDLLVLGRESSKTSVMGDHFLVGAAWVGGRSVRGGSPVLDRRPERGVHANAAARPTAYEAPNIASATTRHSTAQEHRGRQAGRAALGRRRVAGSGPPVERRGAPARRRRGRRRTTPRRASGPRGRARARAGSPRRPRARPARRPTERAAASRG